MKFASHFHNSGVLDTMVSVRDFFGHFFLQNSSQNGLGAPVVTARGRHETSPQLHFPPRRARAMARYSPRQHEWGELPTALQARRPSDSASLLPVKLGEIVDTRRNNRSFSTRPEKSTTCRTSANEICAINFSSRPFQRAHRRLFVVSSLIFTPSKQNRTPEMP